MMIDEFYKHRFQCETMEGIIGLFFGHAVFYHAQGVGSEGLDEGLHPVQVSLILMAQSQVVL